MRFVLLAGLLLGLTAPGFAQSQISYALPDRVKISTGSELATWTLPPNRPENQRKTPIVFLHGGPGLYTEARRFGEGDVFRRAGFTTIYFDQVGGGKSGRIPASEYRLERLVADLEALRIAKGQDKIILWGNSFGASLAAVYADRYPNRVAGLILTSPGMYPGFAGKRDYSRTDRGKVNIGKPLSSAISKIDRDGGSAEANLSQADAGQLFDELVAAELMDGMTCKGATVQTAPLPGGGNLYAQRAVFRDLKKLNFKPQPNPGIPTLIVRGSCDFLPRESAQKYVSQFNGTLVALEGSGHGLLEDRASVDRSIADFLNNALSKAP